MRNFFKKIDETVREMWFGTFLWGCLCELVSVWWVKDRLYSGLGILIGMLLAMAGIWHMWKVLDTALELGFQSYSGFYKFWVKQQGLSPKEYRERYSKENVKIDKKIRRIR